MTNDEIKEKIDNLTAPITDNDIKSVYSDKRVALLHPFKDHIFKYMADVINDIAPLLIQRRVLTEEIGKEKITLLDRLLELVLDVNYEYGDNAEQFLSQVLPLIETVRSYSPNEQNSPPNQRTLLLGFGAFLCSRKEPITCSSTHEVGPLFTAIEEYCQLRDIDPNYGKLHT